MFLGLVGFIVASADAVTASEAAATALHDQLEDIQVVGEQRLKVRTFQLERARCTTVCEYTTSIERACKAKHHHRPAAAAAQLGGEV